MSGDGTLIYSPGIEILIESGIAGPLDVSEDCSSGFLTLRENGSHNVSFVLENPHRKYDGMFIPNDRIVIKMKRFRWLQVFAGYVDTAPYFSTFPGQVTITGQCTLKVLRNWPWDRGSWESQTLLTGQDRDRTAQDGGLSEIAKNLLTKVTDWEEERIHIGRVPEEWFSKFERIYRRLDDDITIEADPLIGLNPILEGKPVGNFNISLGASSTGSTGPTLGSGDKEKMLLDPKDYSIALATIRQLESENNYLAVNKGDGKGDWATGAYQFTDSTWARYGGYERASLAPPRIQDDKALSMVTSLMQRQGNQLLNVPYGWYYPKVFTDPTWLDKIPAANEGNKLTLRQYGYRWVDTYVAKYTEIRGFAPTIGGTATGPIVDRQSSTSIQYPIPPGVNQLKSSEVGWGGYGNGAIPRSAMKFTSRTGWGHPVAVEAWEKLAIAAERAGHNVSGSMYRDLAGQEALKNGAGVKVVGTSNHGWGLAIDVSALVTLTNQLGTAGAVATSLYQWLKANAYKYGFGHPSWAQLGGSKPEPWHWEFFAIYSTDRTIQGVNPFGGENTGLDGISNDNFSKQLFAALAGWEGQQAFDAESEVLFGYKALMNDEAILPTIQQYIQASGRSYCAAPNGDFIAWFPDYWGEYGLAGKMQIEAIELKDFSVDWSDESLITHQFVEGASIPGSYGPAPQGIISGIQAFTTRGVATVDMPNLLTSILNVRDPSQYPWLQNADALFQRFGARVDRSKNPMIFGPHQEFYYAVSKLTRAWAAQFSTIAPLTFMPELFPGMIMEIPLFGVQLYCTAVTHRWNFSNGGGFTTDVQTMAASATDGSGFYLFPKGGDLRPSGASNGGGGGMRSIRS